MVNSSLRSFREAVAVLRHLLAFTVVLLQVYTSTSNFCIRAEFKSSIEEFEHLRFAG